MKEFFDDLISSNEIVTFSSKPRTLASGKKSNTYVNWRNVLTDAFSVDKLSNYIISIVKEKNLNPDSFYGVPESMSLFGGITQLKWASQNDYFQGSHTISMGRGKQKEHGDKKDKDFIGHPEGITILLEDVVTTGNSLFNQIWKLNGRNCDITTVISLTDRIEPKNRKNFHNELQSLRIKYIPLTFLIKTSFKNGDFLISENY